MDCWGVNPSFSTEHEVVTGIVQELSQGIHQETTSSHIKATHFRVTNQDVQFLVALFASRAKLPNNCWLQRKHCCMACTITICCYSSYTSVMLFAVVSLCLFRCQNYCGATNRSTHRIICKKNRVSCLLKDGPAHLRRLLAPGARDPASKAKEKETSGASATPQNSDGFAEASSFRAFRSF